jgi:hypothetical protein
VLHGAFRTNKFCRDRDDRVSRRLSPLGHQPILFNPLDRPEEHVSDLNGGSSRS